MVQVVAPLYLQNAAKPKALAEQILNVIDELSVVQATAAGAAELKELLGTAESSVTAADWLLENL